MDASHTARPGYQLFILVLCLYAIGALTVQRLADLDVQTRQILEYGDFAVCLIFLADFALSFWRAPNRWRYLVTWGWIDLASSIPAVAPARWGRLARILRAFRLLRGIHASKLLASMAQRRAENTLLGVVLVAVLMVVFCSAAILHFESAAESNIKTAEDAVWWAMVTVATVGYGDRYPVTTEGRFVAAILMCVGVGLFSTVAAFLATKFLQSGQVGSAPSQSELAELRREMAALRELLEKQKGGTT